MFVEPSDVARSLRIATPDSRTDIFAFFFALRRSPVATGEQPDFLELSTDVAGVANVAGAPPWVKGAIQRSRADAT
jgi:hypothetical protein